MTAAFADDRVIPFPVQLARRPSGIRAQVVIDAAGRRYDDGAELVAALLMAVEAQPWTPLIAYANRPAFAEARVAVIVGDQRFLLTPDTARTAADALFAEQAYPACIADAATLRDAAFNAETVEGVEQATHGRTGMATCLALCALFLGAALLSQGWVF